MVSLSAARASNASFSVSYRPVALFVGGTSGIGQGTAEAFARATKGNAHIFICGRNKENAEKIIASFPQTPDSKYEFVECDVSLMKNVTAAASSIKERVQTLNYLVLSQGILTTQGYTPTAEGIDQKLALHFYSRWKFVEELAPLLEAASNQGQEVRVMSVLDSLRGAPFQEDNLGLKKNYSLSTAAGQGITYNNLMVEEYAKRYPSMNFSHIFPGFVNTSLLTRNTNPILGGLAKGLSSLFATSLEDCGEYMAYGLLSPKYAKGAFYLDNHGEPVPSNKILTSEAARKTLVEHFKQETLSK